MRSVFARIHEEDFVPAVPIEIDEEAFEAEETVLLNRLNEIREYKLQQAQGA